jgi:hypothetical protein
MGLRNLLSRRGLRVGQVWDGERAFVQERDVVRWPGTYALDGDTPIALLEFESVDGGETGVWVIAEVI